LFRLPKEKIYFIFDTKFLKTTGSLLGATFISFFVGVIILISLENLTYKKEKLMVEELPL